MNTEVIGERLKKIRLEKGLSLEEAQKKTKININILKAIEGDSLTNVNPVYLKGFLKIYCKFLGVDPKDCVPDYKEPRAVIKEPSAEEDAPVKGEASRSILKSPGMNLKGFTPSRNLKRIIGLILAAMVLAVLLFGLGKFIAAKRSSKQGPLKKDIFAPQTPAKVTAVKTRKVEKVKPAPAVKPQVKEPSISKKDAVSGLRLGILARDDCWVTLKADGRMVNHGILRKGKSESWQAKEKFELSVSNAGAIEIELNGQRFSNFGRKGQSLKNILINKDGLHTAR